MDSAVHGLAGMNGTAPPTWDRFAHWGKVPARLLLLALGLILIASAVVPITAGPSTVKTKNMLEIAVGKKGPERKRDEDLQLYDTAIKRISKGENYYSFIVEEHRKSRYPVHPGFAVRLPTLAYIDAALGLTGQKVAALLLLLATMWAWWKRLGEDLDNKDKRLWAMTFLFMGTSLGLNVYYFVLHELWAGMLLALSFGLHRPGKWGASLAVAALALAIREFSLPYVLLMAAMAFWRGDRKEGAAWSILVLLFSALLLVHLNIIAAQVLPTDPPSPNWLVMNGLSGWLSKIVLSSNARFLPHWLAGPLMMLMIFGWAGWRTAAGSFATLLFLGYGLFFMMAGRIDNFYWGAMIAPTMYLGLAFVPDWLKSLWKSAALISDRSVIS